MHVAYSGSMEVQVFLVDLLHQQWVAEYLSIRDRLSRTTLMARHQSPPSAVGAHLYSSFCPMHAVALSRGILFHNACPLT